MCIIKCLADALRETKSVFLHAPFTFWEILLPQPDILVTFIPWGILQENTATYLIFQEVVNFT